jgi:hypothetical protein
MHTRQFGCDEDGDWNRPTKTYKDHPSLENYIYLRREYPNTELEVSVIGGIDQLFYMEKELERFGFDPRIVASVLDADPQAIGCLSLQIMEKLVEARRLAESGETHLVRRGLAVPDKLVDWLIGCMLDALSWTDTLYIPRDLIVLARERLCGSNPEYEQAARARYLRNQAIFCGAWLKARGKEPSYRTIARYLSVAPTTVMRWFQDTDFAAEVEKLVEFYDENGRFRREIFLAPVAGKERCATG